MLYMVACDFADSTEEEAWNRWYSETKLAELLSVPGINASQRFRAEAEIPDPYLAIHSLESADVFLRPEYRSGGGGRFGDRDPALMTHWSRRLFAGLAESPRVDEGERLVLLDAAPDDAPDLGIAFHWLTGVDWSAVAAYRGAVALDASVPHRGLAVVDAARAKALPRTGGLVVYVPLCPKRRVAQ